MPYLTAALRALRWKRNTQHNSFAVEDKRAFAQALARIERSADSDRTNHSRAVNSRTRLPFGGR
jgi:hypothetical protein